RAERFLSFHESLLQCGNDPLRNLVHGAAKPASVAKVVSRPFDHNKGWVSRNQSQSALDLCRRAEGVFRAADEKRRRLDLGKVCGPKLCRLSRRMQRVREDEKPVTERRLLRGQHRGLSPTVRLAAEDQPAGRERPAKSYRPPQTFAVLAAAAPRRPVRTRLAIRKVASQDATARFRECLGQSH